MHVRALAPLGALGLGVLAVVLLVWEGTTPPSSTDTSAPDASSADDARVLLEDGSAQAESRPQATPTLDSLESLTLTEAGQAHLERMKAQIEAAKPETRVIPPPKPTTIAKLSIRPRWTYFLDTWLRLPALGDPKKRFARIDEALARATNPVVRQNLIFLAALAFEPEVSQAWLEAMAQSEDPADAEDALVALAFSGEPSARATFFALADTASTAKVHRILDSKYAHDKLAKQGTAEVREVLRSYRAVEAADRAPYFTIVAFEASRIWGYDRGLGERLRWVNGYPTSAEERRQLYEAFLRRYPGHPGSDDIARRIGSIHTRRGELLEGVRWYSRAATLPDQDKAYAAANMMASYCEIVLTPEDVLTISEDQGLDTPNRAYFQYAWLRRLASDRGFDVAVRAWETLATREPDSELGVAWHRRFSAPVPKGLDSGLAPVAKDDPLRLTLPATIAWPVSESPAERFGREYGMYTGCSWSEETWRLTPWPEVVVLHRGTIVRQARAWVTLAELERRTAKARGTARAELLYKQAAIFYHDRDVLFPAYGYHTMDFSGRLRSATWAWGKEETNERREAVIRFEKASLSYLRAVALFRQIEREHPRYAGLDKVVFSQGLAWRRLTDYRPYYAWSPALTSRWEGRRAPAIREVVAAFERCARDFPNSPLADDAASAAAWWRKARSRVFASD